MAAVGLGALLTKNTMPELSPQCLDANASLLACLGMLIGRSVDKDFFCSGDYYMLTSLMENIMLDLFSSLYRNASNCSKVELY